MSRALSLPLLPTMGVGSYASPGWFTTGMKASRDGGWGAADVEEMLADATRVAVFDQLEAGVDILTDGELRRQRFVYEMYGRIEGLERIAQQRRLGIPGYDQTPAYLAHHSLSAPGGFGLVEDFELVATLAPDRPLKIALPGPLTFGMNILPGESRAAKDIAEEIAALVRAEIDALVAAGADYIQLDEPGLPHPPYGLDPEEGAALINRVLKGVEARRAVHVCFGNNAGRPFADRRFGRLMDAIQSLDCEQLVLEFANREMAELELLRPLSETFEIAAGVVDVKNWRLEPADEIAERIRACLDHVPAEKLTVTADCGFSALPRYLAKAKMTAMVAGARLVRENA